MLQKFALSFVQLCVCVYTSVPSCACVCVCMFRYTCCLHACVSKGACGNQRSMLDVFLLFSTLLFVIGPLPRPEDHCLAARLVSKFWALPVSAPRTLGFQTCTSIPGFSMNTGDANSGPHAAQQALDSLSISWTTVVCLPSIRPSVLVSRLLDYRHAPPHLAKSLLNTQST